MSTTENQAVIDLMSDIDDVSVLDLNGDPKVVSVPKGRTLQSLKPFIDEYHGTPERITGTATLTTLASFIAHLRRFADADSAVFAKDGAAPAMTAVYDYHSGKGPNWGRHRAHYALALSNEWKAWTKADGCWMSQTDFALFLEDRLADIVDPAEVTGGTKELATTLGLNLASRQKLLTLSEGLTVNVQCNVTNHQNLSSGELTLTFAEKHKDAGGNTLKVPNGFVIAIPVFHGGHAYLAPVRLRYRVKDAKVLWCVVVINAQKAIDAAVAEAVGEVAKETSLPVFMGEAEPKL